MDEEQLVDNGPSIKANIRIEDRYGTIHLSSIYSSYNYICSLDIRPHEVAEFSCPHCNGIIRSISECKVCKSPAVSFVHNFGGILNICSRVGCKGHTIEFDDLEDALKKIEKEYWYLEGKERAELEAVPKSLELNESEEHKEVIKTGSFLFSYCPECKKSLIEANQLKLKIVNDDEQKGYVMLSPYLNVFTTKCTIVLTEGKPVKEIRCPHCDVSLMHKDKNCEECGSSAARITVSARSKFIDFYICSRKGCKWHGLSAADMNDIRLEDSLSY